MASTLTVLCPNGRRQTVKVSPNTSVLEVLEQACKKQDLKPDDFDIKHFNKVLDLSLSVRFANLPNNAMLELSPIKEARQEHSITVALQLESGERFTSDFSPSSSMWDVINKYSTQRNSCEDDVGGTVPICVYMRQKFIGDELKTTTLRSIGLTGGKAIIRLIHRPLDSLAEQAHVSAPLCKPPPKKMLKVDEETGVSSGTASADCKLDNSTKSWSNMQTDLNSATRNHMEESYCLPKFEDEPIETHVQDSAMQCDGIAAEACASNSFKFSTSSSEEIDSKEGLNFKLSRQVVQEADFEHMEDDSGETDYEMPMEIGEIKYLGPRNAVLFNLSDMLSIKKEDLPDEFFELTINDVRYLYNDCKRVRQELENAPLLLKHQREARMLQHLSSYQQSVIRVYFPDQLVLQGTFLVHETVQTVMGFVQSYLQNQNLNFYLFISPPKEVLSPEKTLVASRLVPAAVIYFGCDVMLPSYLKPEICKQVSDPRAATIAAAQLRKTPSIKVEAREHSQSSSDKLPLNAFAENSGPSSVAQVFEPQDVQRPSSLRRNSGKVPAWFKLGNK